MALNDAACDLWCQQFGDEDYHDVLACLFPDVFAKNAFIAYLEENGDFDKPQSISTDEMLIAADWYLEIGDEDTATLLRLAVEWRLACPTPALCEIARDVRRQRMSRYGFRYTTNRMESPLFAAIDAIFESYGI